MNSPYEMHRTIMRAFPQLPDGSEEEVRKNFGILFRADYEELRGVIKTYVQSNVEPDWSFLDELNDYPFKGNGMPGSECTDILPTCRRIQSGQVFSFRLRANPTKRIGQHDASMKGKRVELSRVQEQIEWLIRKGQGTGKDKPGGFELVTNTIRNERDEELHLPCVAIRNEGKKMGRKKDASHRYALTHLSVLFEGLLRVTDAEAFVETLQNGIGTGKAFGFGLLSVVPTGSET